LGDGNIPQYSSPHQKPQHPFEKPEDAVSGKLVPVRKVFSTCVCISSGSPDNPAMEWNSPLRQGLF